MNNLLCLEKRATILAVALSKILIKNYAEYKSVYGVIPLSPRGI